MVNRPSVDAFRIDGALAAKGGKTELLGPVQIVAAGTDGDELERILVAGSPGGELAKFFAVLGGSEISATAPGFVPDAPVLDVVRLAGAVVGAHAAQGTLVGRSVAVFNPVVKGQGRETSDICGEIGLGSGGSAEAHELRSAEGVWLASPKRASFRPSCRRTNPIGPVVTVGKAAPGPTNHRNLNLAEFLDNGLAEPAGILNL